ncbi:hypothetical protein [Paenibacillus vietnamensis]|nr:hypothetical protein [Paenibacillus vietnamensis]
MLSHREKTPQIESVFREIRLPKFAPEQTPETTQRPIAMRR